MTTYELLMDRLIRDLGQEEFLKNENYHVIKSSIISGVIAALATNSLEVIVVRKQT